MGRGNATKPNIAQPLLPNGDIQARVDQHERRIGAQLRSARLAAGISQADLAARIGISYQQVHKYERGEDRLTPGRVCDIARELNLPLTFLIEPTSLLPRPISRDEHHRLVDLMRHAHRIRDDATLGSLVALSRDLLPLAGSPPDPTSDKT